MKTRAAIAWEAKKPLTVETIDLAGPKAGEVLVEIKASGVCHTDEYTLSGLDSEGIFPCILGHEGAGIVREVGAGVTSVKPGDHVIPLYTPECRQCKTCLSQRSNLCTSIRATQGQGLMPDRTSRFSCDGVVRSEHNRLERLQPRVRRAGFDGRRRETNFDAVVGGYHHATASNVQSSTFRWLIRISGIPDRLKPEL